MAKIKKSIAFWKAYTDSSISKGAKAEIKRLERACNRHRVKNKRREVAG